MTRKTKADLERENAQLLADIKEIDANSDAVADQNAHMSTLLAQREQEVKDLGAAVQQVKGILKVARDAVIALEMVPAGSNKRIKALRTALEEAGVEL